MAWFHMDKSTPAKGATAIVRGSIMVVFGWNGPQSTGLNVGDDDRERDATRLSVPTRVRA